MSDWDKDNYAAGVDPAQQSASRRHRNHWYFIHIDTCVLCGHEYVDRERRYTRRPRKWQDRHEYSEHACSEHFM